MLNHFTPQNRTEHFEWILLKQLTKVLFKSVLNLYLLNLYYLRTFVNPFKDLV